MTKKTISRTTYGRRPRPKSKSKYRNQKTTLDGFTFDSQKEARRYQELVSQQESGRIRNLELQPKYDLVVDGDRLGYYQADFRYTVVETGAVVTEDVKSPVTKTPQYRIKKKLIKALYDIDILET